MSWLEVPLSETERKRGTVEEVHDVLRRRILACGYQSGERLALDDIALEWNCSVSVVRSAIQLLANEGLVEVRPRSGSYIAGLTIAEVEEICDIRRSLECLAAETAVQRIQPRQLERFRLLVEEMSRPAQSESERDLHEDKNSELHRLLVESSGNGRLVEVYEDLKAHIQIARLRALARLDWKKRLEEEAREHQEMLDSLLAQDAERLKAVLHRHIDRAKVAMIAALQGSRNW
jgi:GntR family transcriptional regulator, rspAB operon transcriptional repressor